MSNDWDETLDHATEAFGQAPNPDLAQLLLHHHQRHPETVRKLINRIADQYANGTVNSPWGVLKAELKKIPEAKDKTSAANDQEKALRRAEQWMRAAGMHYDRYPEVFDELFGDRGQLRHWPHLEERIRELYTQVRPVGEQLEADSEERQARYREQRTTPRQPARKEAA